MNARDNFENETNPMLPRILEPVEYSPLAEQVYNNLREAILSGELAPGTRLVESAIADEMQISRGPVREALSRLEAEGMVEVRPRRGATVTQMTKADGWEVYTLRAALEGLAFKLAGENCSEDDVAYLQAIVDKMETCTVTGDLRGLSALDVQFHNYIVDLAEHRRLRDDWMSIIGQMQLLSRRVITTEYTDLSPIHTRHQQLLDALVNGNADERSKAIHVHIMSVADRVLAHFGD